MVKKHSQLVVVLVAAGLAAYGIVQYLALSGLITLSVATRIPWLFLPAYGIGGAFGVLFQWFLIAALWVFVLSKVAERKRGSEASDPDRAQPEAPAPVRQGTVSREPTTFGRRGRG